jgi:hypothetical protein
MTLPSTYLRSSILSLCIAGFGPPGVAATFSVGSASDHIARTLAEGEKKEDKGEKVAVDKLPKAVSDAVKKAMPGARITKANKLEKDGKVTYYLDDVKVGKKGWDVTVAEDGKILKKEECHDDD